MSENHPEPEVPEAEVQVVECLDGHARMTLEELPPIHSKVASSRILVVQESGCIFLGKVLLCSSPG